MIVVVGGRPADDVSKNGLAYFLYDLGSAVQNMLLAATDLGLATHLIASFDEAVVKRVLRIPDDVRVAIVAPLAYPDAASYDEAAEARLRRRSRLALSEVAYFDAWGARALEPG